MGSVFTLLKTKNNFYKRKIIMVEVIANAEGNRTTPSVVAYTKKGDLLVGQIAKRQAVVNPENTFYSIKRFIGRKTNEVTEELRQVSYKVLQTEDIIKLDCQ